MHIIPTFTFEGFFLGPIYVYVWGLTAAVGVLITVWMASKKVPSAQYPVLGHKISESQYWNLVIMLVVSVFIGARVSYILETWSYYKADPLAVLQLWEGGFSFFGGAVGAILAGYIWGRINKVDFLFLGWLFAPAWLFGLFFGRLGCFLIHDHLGKPTDLPWGVFVQGAYRHEPALYEAVWVLIIATSLYLWDKKISCALCPMPSTQSGNELQVTRIFFPFSLLLYSLGRFFLDFFRADDPRYFNLTLAQWFCLGVIAWVIVVILKGDRKQ